MQRRWVVSPDYRAAIKAISDVRAELGVSQRELARRLAKPPSFINKIEQLERRLDILEFVAIADALGLGVVEMIQNVRSQLPSSIEL